LYGLGFLPFLGFTGTRGISIYLHPVVRTHSMPFKIILSSVLGLPTLDLGGGEA
jgi:hypothetical protein